MQSHYPNLYTNDGFANGKFGMLDSKLIAIK